MKSNNFKWEMVRFHVDFGPASLFERVKYKMKDVDHLQLHGPHYNQRASERNIPAAVIEKINHFDISDWKLVTAEVRADKGKFYNSTWEYCYNGNAYWITIGIGQCVETIVKKTSNGYEKCVREGDIYNFTETVNKRLMLDDFNQ